MKLTKEELSFKWHDFAEAARFDRPYSNGVIYFDEVEEFLNSLGYGIFSYRSEEEFETH